jgi:hypothetical protein
MLREELTQAHGSRLKEWGHSCPHFQRMKKHHLGSVSQEGRKPIRRERH